MMTKINLDELRADREAGTDGPWQVDSFLCDDDRVLRVAMPNTVSGMETATIAFCEANWHEYGNGDRRISFIEAQSNARRIARLPDLEAAYIEAVEALRAVDDAIAEMFRYYDGGETRGSYDGRSERDGLRKAGYKTRATLAKL